MADCEAILDLVPAGSLGIEIGVCHGWSSAAFLRRGCRMVLIDPWENYPGAAETYDEGAMSAALGRLTGFKGWAVLRMKSADAAPLLADGIFDFVWVDGNHLEEYCRADLHAYWPKVKPGGLLMGHDYCNVDYDEHYKRATCGVKRAVDAFAAECWLAVEQWGISWVLRKP